MSECGTKYGARGHADGWITLSLRYPVFHVELVETLRWQVEVVGRPMNTQSSTQLDAGIVTMATEPFGLPAKSAATLTTTPAWRRWAVVIVVGQAACS
jgi:hypothetical protein